MCGRFALSIPPEVLAAFFQLESVPAPFAARYNIAPGQKVATIRLTRQGARRLGQLRWGLVPHWSKALGGDARMINARRETLGEKPAFRDAYRRRRSLIPASGFYEWGETAGGRRQPHYVSRRDGQPLALAALWERWTDPEAPPRRATVDSCTIITTPAEGALKAIHDRAPAVVAQAAWSSWLDREVNEPEALQAMLEHPGELEIVRVSSRVNDPSHDDVQCTLPPPKEE